MGNICTSFVHLFLQKIVFALQQAQFPGKEATWSPDLEAIFVVLD